MPSWFRALFNKKKEDPRRATHVMVNRLVADIHVGLHANAQIYTDVAGRIPTPVLDMVARTVGYTYVRAHYGSKTRLELGAPVR
jgi:hypothetical protein